MSRRVRWGSRGWPREGSRGSGGCEGWASSGAGVSSDLPPFHARTSAPGLCSGRAGGARGDRRAMDPRALLVTCMPVTARIPTHGDRTRHPPRTVRDSGASRRDPSLADRLTGTARSGGRDYRAFVATPAIAGVAILGLATLLTTRLVRVAMGELGYPVCDPAAHGLAGLDLADAVRAGNPLDVLRVLNECVTWPFVHALFLLPGFLLLGNGYATGNIVSAVLLGGTALGTFAAGLALHPTRGPWLG